MNVIKGAVALRKNFLEATASFLLFFSTILGKEILKFKELLDMGVISQEEFESKKKQFIAFSVEI